MTNDESMTNVQAPMTGVLPEAPRRRRRLWRVLPVLIWALLGVALVVAVAQFQVKTSRYDRQGQEFEARYGKFPPAGVEIPKKSYGAIGRWRRAVQRFWEGRNVYLSFYNADRTGPNVEAQQYWADQGPGGEVWLHPNMPFVLVLLTPFGYISAASAALIWNILKAATLVGAILMLRGMFSPRPAGTLVLGSGVVAKTATTAPVTPLESKLPDWILGLALLWSIGPIILDFQHGNTNVFVLGAIVLHLWLYRKGRDAWAGAALALAICLKMTPAIFLLYWLYQRNWRLLAGALAALTIALTVVPIAACIGIAGGDISAGLAHWRTLTGTWLSNEIFPGLVKNVAYPTHANQSLAGVMERYFLAGPDGNIFYNPEDNFYWDQTKSGWITITPLGPLAVQWIIRILQTLIVVAAAWAIGWRKLPRENPQVMLHAAVVIPAMLILNQRTWDHHAAVILIPAAAIWWAIGSGNLSRRVRIASIAMMLLAGLLLWSANSEPFVAAAMLAGRGRDVGNAWYDWYKAAGPTFYSFVLMGATAAACLGVAKRSRVVCRRACASKR